MSVSCLTNFRASGPVYDFEDEVALQYYRVEKTFDGRIALAAGVGGEVSGPLAVGTAGKHDKLAKLSELIDRINERFGTNFTKADQLWFDQVQQEAIESIDVQQAAQVNTIDNFALKLRAELSNMVINRMDKNQGMAERYISDKDFQDFVFQSWLASIYGKLRNQPRADT